MSGYQFQCEDAVMPISDTFGEMATNTPLYNVVAGCVATPSVADMTVATALGLITHFLTPVPIAAAATAWTLVSDPSNPRWAWLAYANTGTPTIISGDPAATPTVPELGDRVAAALYYVQAALTVASNATYKFDQRIPATEPKQLHNYNAATQVFTTSTTYANVVGALTTGATATTFSFDAIASGVYDVVYYLPIAFGGTGGAKFQITGPATPTSVAINGTYGRTDTGASGSIAAPFPAVAAFSTDIAAFASAASGASVTAYCNVSPSSFIQIRLRLVNGSTAGVVTLQAAQQNANSTTTLGLGATMTVVRVA